MGATTLKQADILTIEGETLRQAFQLAELTGEDLGHTVAAAIRQRLERERAAHAKAAWKAEIRQLVDDLHEHLPTPTPTSDHGWLCDAVTGLPK